MIALSLYPYTAFGMRVPDQHPGDPGRGHDEKANSRVRGPRRHGSPVKSRRVQAGKYRLSDRESEEEPQKDLVESFGVLAYRGLALVQQARIQFRDESSARKQTANIENGTNPASDPSELPRRAEQREGPPCEESQALEKCLYVPT